LRSAILERRFAMKLCKIATALLGTAIVSMSISGALAASRQDIVGAWSIGDTTFEDSSVIVLDGNGGYYQIQNSLASRSIRFRIPTAQRG
jgi:hypothetical protein